MDIEQLTHLSYKKSLVIALVLSGLAVAIAAILGRGTLNLRASLTLEEPSDVTLIAALYEANELEENGAVTIKNIQSLRKEKSIENDRPVYSYMVSLSSGENYLAKLAWDGARWQLTTMEKLHGEATPTDTEAPEAESVRQR